MNILKKDLSAGKNQHRQPLNCNSYYFFRASEISIIQVWPSTF